MLKVSKPHLALIQTILKKYLPDCEVRAFGSRVQGKERKYSDLDLVVLGKGKIERHRLVLLKEAFEESSLPFRLDILDFHRMTPEFKKAIGHHFVLIQEPSHTP